MSTCTPSYRLDLTEEQLVLLVAMLGVALEDAPMSPAPMHSDDILHVMRSLARVVLAVDLPGELREILGPALTRLMVTAVSPPNLPAGIHSKKH